MIDDNYNLSVKSKKQSSSETSDTAPTQRPKKDFQKVLKKEESEEEKQKQSGTARTAPLTKKGESFAEISDTLTTEESTAQKKGVSLFDLARKTPEELEASQAVSSDVEQDPSLNLPEDVKEHSLQALFQTYGLREEPEFLQKESKRGKEIEDSVLKFSKTPPDLAALPAAAAGTTDAKSPIALSAAHAGSRILELKEIIDQIVDKLYTIESKGRTDLVIKLSHPPLLAGSSVVITSFSAARREFNISFENLSLAAQKILGAQENQNSLKSALEEKGFVAHIITATTLRETTALIEERTSETLKGRPQDDEQGTGKRKNKKREHDEV